MGPLALVPEKVQLETVIEVETLVADLAMVRLDAAVDASLVVVQRALSRKLLTALIAGVAATLALHVARAMFT